MLKDVKALGYLFAPCGCAPGYVQINIFSSATPQTFGVLTYAGTEEFIGAVSWQSFLASARVAPMKQMSPTQFEFM